MDNKTTGAAPTAIRFNDGELAILEAARALQEPKPNLSQYIRKVVLAAAQESVLQHAGR